MSTINFMRVSEFNEVFDRNWQPVVLQGQAIPRPLRDLPPHLDCGIIASGERMATAPYSSRRIRAGRLVGGIDVYRASPEDPVALNKDWYAVVASDAHPDALFIEGPSRDSEHWLDAMPSRYSGAEVIVL